LTSPNLGDPGFTYFLNQHKGIVFRAHWVKAFSDPVRQYPEQVSCKAKKIKFLSALVRKPDAIAVLLFRSTTLAAGCYPPGISMGYEQFQQEYTFTVCS